MPNPYFSFKAFTIFHDRCGMKVTTEACLLGAWFANKNLNARCILDIGSGSGLLMLMLAQKTEAIINGVEIDEESFVQSKENIANSPWHQRLTVLQKDARKFVDKNGFDFIISNPPFYEMSLHAASEPINLARHSSALDFTALLKAIDLNLIATGSCGILLPYDRVSEFQKLAGDFNFNIQEQLNVRQTTDHKYFRSILTLSRINNACRTLELSIKDSYGTYTPEFRKLLKDYYLH